MNVDLGMASNRQDVSCSGFKTQIHEQEVDNNLVENSNIIFFWRNSSCEQLSND